MGFTQFFTNTQIIPQFPCYDVTVVNNVIYIPEWMEFLIFFLFSMNRVKSDV